MSKPIRVTVDFTNPTAQCWQAWPEEDGEWELIPVSEIERLREEVEMDESCKTVAAIVFDRHEMKEAIEASDVRGALNEYERWLHYALDLDDDEEWLRAINDAREGLFKIFSAWGVSVWEE